MSVWDVKLGCLIQVIRHLVTKYIESQNMPNLKFERSKKKGRISFNGQNMPDVIILVFRKRGLLMSDILLNRYEKVEKLVFNFDPENTPYYADVPFAIVCHVACFYTQGNFCEWLVAQPRPQGLSSYRVKKLTFRALAMAITKLLCYPHRRSTTVS